MQRIYEPTDLLEAQLLLDVLASEGIEVHLVGRDLVGGLGELPALGLLALLVADADADRAQQLIAAYNAAAPMPGDESQEVPGILLC